MGLGECRKFEPNQFNKLKCSNCYKLKMDHSEAALEVAKTARNVSRCGYLFVAPDWDFTNPIYRTKRWQRRWFVLFDDGELTYSIDDHPETVPYCTLDMNNVFEITSADGITGNCNSIAIVAPDGIHFIKGSCSEESRLWLDILKLFAASSTNIRKEGPGGRAKRSATFPGIRNCGSGFRDSIKKLATQGQEGVEAEEVEEGENSNQYESEDLQEDIVEEGEEESSEGEEEEEEGEEEEEEEDEDTEVEIEDEEDDTEEDEASGDDNDDGEAVDSEEEKLTELYSNLEQRRESLNQFRSLQSSRESRTLTTRDSESRLSLSSLASSSYTSIYSKRKSVSPEKTYSTGSVTSTTGSSVSKARTTSVSGSQEPLSRGTRESSIDSQFDMGASPRGKRGVPDGGNLDLESSVDLNMKKGWLMKESQTKEWHKYWFVLQDGALMYYRDPAAESNGFLDGVIALNLVESISAEDLNRNFGFSLKTFEPRTHRLSAITAGIRQKWIDALKSAAHISSKGPKSSGTQTEEGREPETRQIKESASSSVLESLSNSKERLKMKGLTSRSESSGNLGLKSTTQTVESKIVTRAGARRERLKSRSKTCSEFSTARYYEPAQTQPEPEPEPIPEAVPVLEEAPPINNGPTEQMSLLSEETKELKKRNDQLESELKALRAQWSNALEEAEALRAKFEKEKEASVQLKHQVDAFEKRLSDLNVEKRLENEKLVRMMQENTQLKQQCQEQQAVSEKWKSRYDAVCFESEELQERINAVEEELERRSTTFGEQTHSKDQIISDLSEQLKESEERIQDLLSDVDYAREDRKTIQQAHEEEISRLIVAVESKFNEEKTKEETERRSRQEEENAVTSNLEMPKYKGGKGESTAPPEEVFSDLCNRLQTAIDEIDHLKRNLRESQMNNDSMEVEKVCLEQAFKRTILMHEEQEKLLVERVQDLTNKLYSSEKTLRQMKERRLSKQMKMKEKQQVSSSS